MYLKSPFPDPPKLPEANAHNIFFKRPDQSEWSDDFIVHIDGESDEKIGYREFTSRIKDLATGLGAPIQQGGMGLRAAADNGGGEIVGIMAENSSVSFLQTCFLPKFTLYLIGIHHTPPFMLIHNSSFHLNILPLNTTRTQTRINTHKTNSPIRRSQIPKKHIISF